MVKKIVAVSSLAFVLCLAGSVKAQTVVNVTATVGQTCVAISDGAMNFNITDSSVLTPATSVVLPAIQCTSGAVATISAESTNAPGAADCSVGAGFGGLLDNGSGLEQIFYNFECGTGSVVGIGLEPVNPLLNVAIPIDGSVGPNEAITSPQGSYTDTITLTFAL